MPRIATKILSALLCVCLTACTSLRTVPDWRASASPKDHAGSLRIGDELALTTASAGQVFMLVSAIEPGVLVGRADRADLTRVPFDQITNIERREFDVLKTTLLIVLIAVAGLAAAAKNAAFFPPPP